MAEEVSVSKFEYNDEDLDEVTETDEEQDGNQNDFNEENLVKKQEDPNVRIVSNKFNSVHNFPIPGFPQ